MNTREAPCRLVLRIVCVVIPSTSYAQATSDTGSFLISATIVFASFN